MNTAAGLENNIFQQFLRFAMRLPAGDCLDAMDRCNFDYNTERIGINRIMNIWYTHTDACCRTRCPMVRVDYTNICYSDLCDEQWLVYLGKAAEELVEAICPPQPIVCLAKRKCRDVPKCWKPEPCCNTTIITKCVQPKPVIVQAYEQEECDECAAVCPCEEKKPVEKIIIRQKICKAPCPQKPKRQCGAKEERGFSTTAKCATPCGSGCRTGCAQPAPRPAPVGCSSCAGANYMPAAQASEENMVLVPVQL